VHGLTVADALTRTDDALDDALRRNADGVRLIHGRSGGRIRSAVHARLRAIPSVRAFRIDPRNEGVTVVTL
jgi:dsDNA-specific endonuclease/ATPase MutS2